MEGSAGMSVGPYNADVMARLVFLQDQADAHNDRAIDREMQRPAITEKIRALQASIKGHQAIYDDAVKRGVPKGKRLIPDLPPEKALPVGGELFFDGKKFRRFADSDETLPRELISPEREREFNDFQTAEKDFLEHAKTETGECLSPEKAAEKDDEKKTLLKQTLEIARRLETAGVHAYRRDELFSWIVGVHTRKPEKIEPFRRCCILPSVASKVRAGMVAALEYWFQSHPYERFYTLTSGTRVRVEHLRERIAYQHQRINRLNTYLREEWGAEIVFRSTELGNFSKEKKETGALAWDKDGEPLYHVHTHCVVHSLVGYRPRDEWSRMLSKIKEFWGHHWDEGGKITKIRECCKYVTKPGELLKLTPEQLKKLHVATFRMRMVSPLGRLRKQIASWSETTPRKVLRRYSTPDGSVWRLKLDQNAHAKIDEDDRWAAFDLERDDYAASLDGDIEKACIQKTVIPLKEKMTGDWCRVVARLSPKAGADGVKEPRIFVIGTKYDENYVNNHPLVQSLWSNTVFEYEAGVAMAASIRVHTFTLTSAEKEDGPFGAYSPGRMKPPNLEFTGLPT